MYFRFPLFVYIRVNICRTPSAIYSQKDPLCIIFFSVIGKDDTSGLHTLVEDSNGLDLVTCFHIFNETRAKTTYQRLAKLIGC